MKAFRGRWGCRRLAAAPRLALVVLLPALARLACAEPAPVRSLLLISLDSTRRDLLSVYGHRAPHAPERPSSPHLDRLAAEGVLMEEAYASSSWTLPSHVALMSGEPDVVHGVDLDNQRPDPGRKLLAEILRERGYRTAGFYTGPYLGPQFGFDRGFDRYEASYGERLEAATNALAAALRRRDAAEAEGDEAERSAARRALAAAERELEVRSHRDVSAGAVTDAALAELASAAADGRPFFVFVHYFDPHYDYVPPAPHDAAFDPDYTGAVDGRDFIVNSAIAVPEPYGPHRLRRVVSERDLAHVRALYAGELAATDAQVGRLVARLDALGLAGSTLVVVTSDHGTEFFEHGGIGHRNTLYEEVVRVPLILRLPGALPAGRRVAGLVSLADVLPSVLELLGLDPPSGLASHSFVPLIFAREQGEAREVLGRVVTLHDGEIEVPGVAEPWIDARLVRFIETYRRGPIKIIRERRAARPRGPLDPDRARALSAESARMQQVEHLTWIDLERHPDEPASAWSQDFDDPRARAALLAFRESYAGLIARRRASAPVRVDEPTRTALRALGYAEGDVTPSEVDGFALPLPGEALLGNLRGDGAP